MRVPLAAAQWERQKRWRWPATTRGQDPEFGCLLVESVKLIFTKALIADATILHPALLSLPGWSQWLIQCLSFFGAIITKDAAARATVMLACEKAKFRAAFLACMDFGVLLPFVIFYIHRRQPGWLKQSTE
jgi:hypothetical protein